MKALLFLFALLLISSIASSTKPIAASTVTYGTQAISPSVTE